MLAAAAIAARITRLATKDTITAPIRQWIGDRSAVWETFVSCAWCIGWWITLAVFAVAYVIWPGHDWSAPQLLVWSAAACATNLTYATIASTTARIGDLADTLELRILSNRRESL